MAFDASSAGTGGGESSLRARAHAASPSGVRPLTPSEERIAEGGVVRYSGSFREEQRTASGRGSPSVRVWRGERMGGRTEDNEGSEGETPAGRRKAAVAARSSRKDDGKYRAEQSSWRRLNKSHYKLASAGCTKLTNSLYIKTNRPSAFLTHPAPAHPPTAINFRNGFPSRSLPPGERGRERERERERQVSKILLTSGFGSRNEERGGGI